MEAILRPLWPHQETAIENLREALRTKKRRVMLQMPTGSAKTLLASRVIAGARAKGSRVIFVAPYSTLIDQTIAVFENEGHGPIGAMQADHPRTNPYAPLQIATSQTLKRREKPDVDLVFVDEAHRMDEALFDWLKSPEMQAVPVIGLSATPWSKGLGKHYDHLIVGATTASLIEAGHLSPFRVFAPTEPDLARVRTLAADFREDDLADAMNTPQLVGDIVNTWLARAKDLPTLAFCVDRLHAAHVEQRFRETGVASEYLDGLTPRAEREQIFARFRSGETKILVNIDVLTAGFDADVRCLIDARPTKSEIRYTQMFGRGLRSAPGKERLIVLDHAGNALRLGLVTSIHHDTLDNGDTRKASEKAERKSHDVRLCGECKAVMARARRICDACGYEKPAATPVVEHDGELVELGTKAASKSASPSLMDQATFFSGVKFIAGQKNYKPGWAPRQFYERFGHWPNDPFLRHAEPQEPDLRTRNWVKSRAIAYAKRRRA